MTDITTTPSKREIVEAELRAIWNERGRLVPVEVVDVAADPAHPLHPFFEWDDTEAARLHRKAQAAALIRSVKVRVTSTDGAGQINDYNVRAWLPARAAGAPASVPAGYIPAEEARADPEVRDAILRQMMREANAFRRRYEHLAEFWNLIGEIASERAEAS